MTISAVNKNLTTQYRKPFIFICPAPRKKQVDTLERSRQEKANERPLIEMDSDDDNESETDLEKDIEKDIDME